MADGRQMALFPNGCRQLLRRCERSARNLHTGGLGPEQVQPRPQRVRHHELGAFG
jgi:hypothetical protein